MSAADKKKLDGISSEVTNIQVTSGSLTYGSTSTIVDGHLTIPHRVDLFIVSNTSNAGVDGGADGLVLFANLTNSDDRIFCNNTSNSCEITFTVSSNYKKTVHYYAIRFI